MQTNAQVYPGISQNVGMKEEHFGTFQKNLTTKIYKKRNWKIMFKVNDDGHSFAKIGTRWIEFELKLLPNIVDVYFFLYYFGESK